MQVQNQDKKILLHACCGICSGYPISMLKDMGYSVTVYFYNPNIYPKEEYEKRLSAEKILCEHFNVQLIEGEYNLEDFYIAAKGFETEPEKGLRCDKCFELRLNETAKTEKIMGFKNFTTSIVISPHKNYEKLTRIGCALAEEYGINYVAIDFKKKDGFLKTNNISKALGLYRQNYCGCEFSLRK